MRRPNKIIRVVSVNVVLLLVLVEIAGVITFYVEEDHLFYRRALQEQPPSDTVEAHAQTRQVLHPVLGFIRRPDLPITDVARREQLDRLYGPGLTTPLATLRANNFGFFSRHDYPYTPPGHPFLIGVFGGSVAQWLALQGAPTLIDRLQQVPGLAHRRIEVLNFAQGSFKQPQQLHTLAYFLSTGQRLDFILNIDGFNEVALGLLNVQNRIDPSLPSSQQLLPLTALIEGTSLSLEQIETFARAKRSEERLTSLEARIAHVWSAGVWLVLEVFRQRASQRYNAASGQLAEGLETVIPHLLHLNRWPAGKSEATLDFIGSTWMHTSILMADLLRARGILYLHVLQPNQYFSQKTFTDEEKRVALNTASPYAKHVTRGYPYLLERVSALQAQEVQIVSAVDLFDAIPQTVYADNCCHYNQFGNEVFARFLADHMARILASQDGPPLSTLPEE